jgi:3-hydroxyisobutyrate dehydrogenase
LSSSTALATRRGPSNCPDVDAFPPVTALGREHDVPFELSELVERIYQRALARYGPVDGELLAVALLEEQAGLRLRHDPPG